MLTGTPLDLTSSSPPFSAPWLPHWALALGAGGPALLWSRLRSWRLRVPLGIALVAASIYPVATCVRQKRQLHGDATAGTAVATNPFQERCKAAGEELTLTVKTVDREVRMKWRAIQIGCDFRVYGENDQMFEEAV